MEKKILYIHRKDVDKVNKARGVAIIRKIRLLSAPEEEILSLPEDAELLKFIGFSPKEVGDFLTDLKKLGIRVDLKCMETEHNRDWSLLQLYKELEEEHRYMTARRQEQQNEEKSS